MPPKKQGGAAGCQSCALRPSCLHSPTRQRSQLAPAPLVGPGSEGPPWVASALPGNRNKSTEVEISQG
eukprot:1431840-Prymnesium_polylepis.1